MKGLAEASKYLGVTRQAVRNAITQKRINAMKVEGKWRFSVHDLDDYKNKRYKREFCTFNGEPLYDKSKGEFSITEAAEILGCPKQHLYYAARLNRIKTTRKRKTWIITADDICEYRKIMVLQKKKS